MNVFYGTVSLCGIGQTETDLNMGNIANVVPTAENTGQGSLSSSVGSDLYSTSGAEKHLYGIINTHLHLEDGHPASRIAGDRHREKDD